MAKNNQNKQMTGVTRSGFKFSVKSKALDDIRIIEAAAYAEESPKSAIDFFNILLGKPQYEALKKHITSIAGYPSAEKINAEIQEICKSVNLKK